MRCSLAGTLGLGSTVFDDNGISIDGDVRGWFSDDTPARFESYGWQVIREVDGHDALEVETALETARKDKSRPTLICCRTVIGFGSPNLAGSEKTHGAPLGDMEIQATRDATGCACVRCPGTLSVDAKAKRRGSPSGIGCSLHREQYPDLASEFERRMQGVLPANALVAIDRAIADTQAESPKIATRKASQNAIEVVARLFPEMFGGSADLGHSNLTVWPGHQVNSADNPGGNYVHMACEFGMRAIMNGVALHGGLFPFGGTFLIFMEYARNAVRMAALMKQRVVYVFTHDSIGLGEDGPTHQPVEQLASLRSTPGLEIWRPCDTTETFVAWKEALSYRGPTALALSRQGLANQARDEQQVADIARGGYILRQEASDLELILIATGSEVEVVMAAAEVWAQGCAWFLCHQPAVLINKIRITVRLFTAKLHEAAGCGGRASGWLYKYGLNGSVIGMRTFENPPGGDVMRHFGFTVEHVVATAKVQYYYGDAPNSNVPIVVRHVRVLVPPTRSAK